MNGVFSRVSNNIWFFEIADMFIAKLTAKLRIATANMAIIL